MAPRTPKTGVILISSDSDIYARALHNRQESFLKQKELTQIKSLITYNGMRHEEQNKIEEMPTPNHTHARTYSPSAAAMSAAVAAARPLPSHTPSTIKSP